MLIMSNKIKKIGVVVLALPILFGIGLQSSFAQDTLPTESEYLIEYVGPNAPDTELPQDIDSLLVAFIILLGWLQVFFWILAVAMGVYAAYLYLTSAGDPGRVSKASQVLIYVVVAVVVAIIAYVLPVMIESFVV